MAVSTCRAFSEFPLGMESSPAFVREPQGNGCAEPSCAHSKFAVDQDVRYSGRTPRGPLEFKDTYNETWLIGDMATKRPRMFVKSNGLPSPNKQPEF